MRKMIDFQPYTEAEIKQVNEDGSVLCNLYGGKVATEVTGEGDALEGWEYHDTNICFPEGSDILSMSKEEIQGFGMETKGEGL